MSNTVFVIQATEIRAWSLLLERAGGGDQFHLAGYVQAIASERGGQAEAAWFECEEGCAFYPYVRTAAPIDSGGRYDIESPYGYSGPIFSSDSATLRSQFYAAFHEWCMSAQIVTEFVRLNPFLPRAVASGPESASLVSSDLYVMDLGRAEELRWREIRKGHRQSIRKAAALGVRPLSTRLGSRVGAFWNAYTATMRRNNASAAYFFSQDFFVALDRACGNRLDLWVAEWHGEEVAYVIVLRNGEWGHYFLSAATHAGRESCATHLLLWQATQELSASGVRTFNLGGAPAGDGPLESFKRGFTKRTVPFHTVRAVHDPVVFSSACAAVGVAARLDGYFPPYKRTASRPAHAPAPPIVQQSASEIA